MIHCMQYEDNAIPRQSVYDGIQMLKSRRTIVMNVEPSGRPSASTTDQKREEDGSNLLAYKKVTTENIRHRPASNSSGENRFTRHQSNSGSFVDARQSCVPQSFGKMATQRAFRRIQEWHDRGMCSTILTGMQS